MPCAPSFVIATLQKFAFLLAVPAVFGPTQMLLAADGLEKVLQGVVDQHEGDCAVAIRNAKTGEEFFYQADNAMPTASLVKFPLMIAAYEKLESGELNPSDMITLKESDKVPGSGILTSHFSAGTQISLLDAIRLMIVYSDNTATNLVVEQVGLEAAAKSMDRLECPETKIHSQVFKRETSIFPERSVKYGLGSTTAREMLSLLIKLQKRELVSPSASEAMYKHMLACDDKSKLARDLPSGVRIAHKSGAVNATRTDAGIIASPNGDILICVLTNNNKDQSWSDSNQGDRLIGQIAELTYEYFNPDKQTKTEDESTTLSIGSQGELVSALQRTLNSRLPESAKISVDGDFGPATQGAVIKFQELQKLDATGAVDESFWKALGPLVAEKPVPSPEVVNAKKLELQPMDLLSGSPFVSARAWAIVDGKTGEVLDGKAVDKPEHIASTTKLMTAYLVFRLAQDKPEVLDEIIVFSRRADDTVGSTAGVKAGEKVSVRELLYGLLLPSGNDASVAFAEHFGNRVAPKGSEHASPDEASSISKYDQFIQAMNDMAKTLGMLETSYKNPHGLTADGHRSSPRDLAKLAMASMELPLFPEYVKTRQRGSMLTGPTGYQRPVVWENTNKLLEIEGYDGLKTGTTDAAGACLVSRGTRDGKSIYVIVLGASSSDGRYVDSRNLYRWGWSLLSGKEESGEAAATNP